MYFKRNVKDDGSHGDENERSKLYLTYDAGGCLLSEICRDAMRDSGKLASRIMLLCGDWRTPRAIISLHN